MRPRPRGAKAAFVGGSLVAAPLHAWRRTAKRVLRSPGHILFPLYPNCVGCREQHPASPKTSRLVKIRVGTPQFLLAVRPTEHPPPQLRSQLAGQEVQER